MTGFIESNVEEALLDWFKELGYELLHGPDIAPGEMFAERESYQEVLLCQRLKDALIHLNPAIPVDALDDAYKRISRPQMPTLEDNNRVFHHMLVDGVEVEYKRKDGSIAGDRARIIDYDNPDSNNWLAVNQFTVVEGQINRRPDVIIFINGIPLAVIELKNPADENATICTAFNQLQTYKRQVSNLFVFNELLVVSDGIEARVGSVTANREWFKPWHTIEGEELASDLTPQLQVMTQGIFEKNRLLDLLRHFIVFEDNEKRLIKKIAGYHQFHAVRTAVESTVQAAGPEGDKRSGVVWHTQGSGKSLTMLFYAGKLVLHPTMENPTLVLLTDRNDLDNQLFGVFAGGSELLRQTPVQAENRNHLRQLLKVASGGIVFTTIQKFFPEEKGDQHPLLSDRRNIVVIADEAHRSQYDFIDGFARHMRDALPNASFIGFTGTPIELTDKNTRAVFGNYISIYDIQQAVYDGATVPIYYESRLAKLDMKETEKPHLDKDFEEVTEGEELERKEKLKTKWAALEAVVGTENRLSIIVEDLIQHYENRLDAMEGKAMIVCMSRRICVDLYRAIIKVRPQWHSENDDKGMIKVVMTGSASDPLDWQQHVRNKIRRDKLATRFKDPTDPFKIVIVRDMWLTGFDAPSLHTMYLDKPMRGHGLMQAIARVNRVFEDKPGGLVVDYLGIADHLKRAMANYTESGGRGETAIDQAKAVAIMLEKYEICAQMFHGFDYEAWKTGTSAQKLSLIPSTQEHILQHEDGKSRYTNAVTQLSHAFALSVPHEEALKIRDDVGFFQAVKAALIKRTIGPKTQEELDQAIRQIVSRAISSDEVIDIFSAAGLKKPDISILSDEFLAEVKGMPHKNLAVELLQKLLNDEIKISSRKNLVKARSFAEMLERTIKAYKNRAVEAAKIIEELIALAKEMREANKRGEKLGLAEDELAFYDALETNDSAVKILGDDTLKKIARELVERVKKNVTIDWEVKESVRAKLRTIVKRILRKYDYPPDKQERATKTVLKQAEVLCKEWVA